MGSVFQATQKAADAPNIEPAVYDLRFDGVEKKLVKGGQYQKNPNGDPKIAWKFTLLEDDGSVIYDDGDPVEVEALTGVGFNTASKTVPQEVRILKALMTADEFEAWVAGEGVDADELLGRTVQGEVFIKDSGYPGVTNIIAPRRRRAVRKTAAAAAAEAEAE